MVGASLAVLGVLANYAIYLGSRTLDENAWDDEVAAQIAPIQKQILPLTESVVSLSIDRKRGVISTNEEKRIKLQAKPSTPERKELINMYQRNENSAQAELDQLLVSGNLLPEPVAASQEN